MAANAIGQYAEKIGAEGSREQGDTIDQSNLECVQVPEGDQERVNHANNEEVIGISEKTHARSNHRLPMEAREAAVIQLSQQLLNRMRGRLRCQFRVSQRWP